MSTHRPTQRKLYDVGDLLQLCAADLEIVMHPLALTGDAREKLAYWLGRAWDAGHCLSDKQGARPPRLPDE